jgi:hypothetical protein
MADPPLKGAPRDPVAPRAASGTLPVPQKAKPKTLLLSDIFKSVVAARPKAPPPVDPAKSDPPPTPKTPPPADPAWPDVPAKPRKRTIPMGKRKLLGIDGICRRGETLFVFVRFEDSQKVESVPVELLHHFYLNQLLAFYEEHIILSRAGE